MLQNRVTQLYHKIQNFVGIITYYIRVVSSKISISCILSFIFHRFYHRSFTLFVRKFSMVSGPTWNMLLCLSAWKTTPPSIELTSWLLKRFVFVSIKVRIIVTVGTLFHYLFSRRAQHKKEVRVSFIELYRGSVNVKFPLTITYSDWCTSFWKLIKWNS